MGVICVFVRSHFTYIKLFSAIKKIDEIKFHVPVRRLTAEYILGLLNHCIAI